MINAVKNFFEKIKTRFEPHDADAMRDTFYGELNYEAGRVFYIVFIAAFLFLPYIPNDLLMHPYPILLVTAKVTFSLICLALIALRVTKRFKRKPGLLFMIMVGCLFLMSALIMATSGAYAASYISSFSLVIVLFLFAPLPSKFKLISAVSTVFVFTLLGFIFGIDLSEIPVRNAIFDFLAVVMFSLLISGSMDKVRYKAWGQRKQLHTTLEELSYRDSLLNAANQASAILLEPDVENFENSLHEAMGIMARAVNAERMYVWKNYYVGDVLYTSQIYEWSGGAEPQQGNDLTLNTTFPEYWCPQLMQNKCINSFVRDLPEEEREFMQEQGIKSILVEPIFINDNFWGIVGFDDCNDERVFTDSEEMILRSVSRMITNALIRREMTQDILTTSERLRALNEMSTRFLSHTRESFEDKMSAGIELIAKKIDFDRVSVWQTFMRPEGMHTSQAYVWDRKVGGTKKPDFVGVPITQVAHNWNKLAFSDTIINCPVRLIDDPVTRKVMTQFGVLSVLITPIIIDDVLWGFVLFEDHSKERVFDDNAVDAMCSAAYMCTNTVIAREMERNLEDAFDSATAASHAKSEFLSNMSHEMRTPMNAIIGMTAIGKKSGDIDGKNHALDKIGNASTHLLGVINDILDMSKIEANKLDLVPVEYNFERMLQNVVSVVNFRVEEKQQHLTVNVDSNIPRFIIGDDLRLAQVVTNMMSNAVKFTPEGGAIRLEASLIREIAGECEICIEVIDNGIGISPEQQERLFVAFEQAESGTSREYGGTGLGLVISKRIAELMNGSIRIKSEIGKGARFILTIKAMRGKTGVDMHMIKPLFSSAIVDCINEVPGVDGIDANDDVRTGEFNGKRLLIAEDIEINREILISLLDNTGLIIDCAENGNEALDMLTAPDRKYDIVFMDVQMPQMDGLEATRQIRAHPALRDANVPIIAMTANVFREDIEECLAAGMDDHLGKPLDIDKVLEKLRKYLST